ASPPEHSGGDLYQCRHGRVTGSYSPTPGGGCAGVSGTAQCPPGSLVAGVARLLSGKPVAGVGAAPGTGVQQYGRGRGAYHSWLGATRSEEHTSELQSRENLVCRLLLEKKKKNTEIQTWTNTYTQ